MEFVEGEDLRAVMRREAPLAPARAARIFGELLRAVAVAHEAGVLHRDLKPENVMIAPGDQVKVTDFGLGEARENAERPLLRSGELESGGSGPVAGTPAYMAPEQLAGERVDERADVFALGVILFEMLTGKRPQPGDRPSDFVSGLTPGIDALFALCYTRVEKRARSASSLLDALAPALADAESAQPAATC
jgi:serine/threonine-protein kinase